MQLAKVTTIIPCAGQGKRMGINTNKPYIEIAGKPLLLYTLRVFQEHPLIDEIVLAARASEISYCWEQIVYKYSIDKVKKIIVGGKERQESVSLALNALDDDTHWVVVHDGVRPLLSEKTLSDALTMAFEKGSAVVGVPAKDTIKIIGDDLTIKATPPRESLWLIQTPQIFSKELLLKAHGQAKQNGWIGTDDSSLVERLGCGVYMVKGEYSNIKVTTPEDIIYLKAYLRMEA